MGVPSDSCYRLLGTHEDGAGISQTFASLPLAASGWGPQIQHGGPVAALLVRAVTRNHPRDDVAVSRVTVEILGPIGQVELHVRTEVARPGRRIELVSASLDARTPDGDWRTAARASVWRLAIQDTGFAAHRAEPPLPPLPDPAPRGLPAGFPVFPGFIQGIDLHLVNEPYRKGTPTQAWLRLAVPIVAGEAPTPLEQLLAMTDFANGVGARLDPGVWTYLNTDLTVHLFDQPTGEWFGLAAETSVGSAGAGLSAAVLHDRTGAIGRVAQTLLVERRPERVRSF